MIKIFTNYVLPTKGATRHIEAISNEAAYKIAEYAKRRFSEALAPGGRYNVGASGRASKNFYLTKTTLNGNASWTVVEGNLTDANQMIRSGLPPRNVSRARQGRGPGEATSSQATNQMRMRLERWAIEKGVPLREPTDNNSSARWRSNPVRYTKVRRNRPSYPYKADRDSFDKAIDHIYWALIRYGTQRGKTTNGNGAHWMSLFPKGRGYFDYVQTVIHSSDRTFKSEVRKAADDAGMAIVEFLLGSGRTGSRNYQRKRAS